MEENGIKSGIKGNLTFYYWKLKKKKLYMHISNIQNFSFAKWLKKRIAGDIKSRMQIFTIYDSWEL